MNEQVIPMRFMLLKTTCVPSFYSFFVRIRSTAYPTREGIKTMCNISPYFADYSCTRETRASMFTFQKGMSTNKTQKLNQRGYFFETRLLAPFKKCLSFLDFLRYCTMGKARAFRKGLFNRRYGAFSFGKNFLLSTFILVLLKAL